jgi:putative intracellular protease/amidase
MSTGRILIGMTSHSTLGDTGRSTGAYIPEVAHAWQVFAAAGYDVDLMSVQGGTPPLDAVDRADPPQAAFLDDPVMAERLTRTLIPAEVDPAAYDAIFWAGGHGAAFDLPDDAAGAALTARLYDAGRVVGAVCHGPAALERDPRRRHAAGGRARGGRLHRR